MNTHLMKRILLLLAVLCTGSLLIAQNYQTFRSDRLYYYERNSSSIMNVHFDSLKIDGADSILFPNKSPLTLEYGCMQPDVASWIGERIVIKEDGVNVFFNYNHDSIKIKTLAEVSESWLAHKTDSTKIEATITKKELVPFIGYTDSVKTIEFQVYDLVGNEIDSKANSVVLKLSKNFGFFQSSAFYFFPDLYEEAGVYYEMDTTTMLGVNHPQMGLQNLTTFQLFDFNPGDEIHELDSGSTFSGTELTTTIKATISKYLSRENYQDSIVYTVERKTGILSKSGTSLDYISNEETVREVIVPTELLDQTPGEMKFIDGGIELDYSTLSDSSKTVRRSSEFRWEKTDDECWGLFIIDYIEFFSGFEYIKGLGGPYWYSQSYWFPYTEQVKKLVYYKKGGETWGVPLSIDVGNSSSFVQNKPNVYPNPAKDWITIDTGNESIQHIELLDMTGKLILTNAKVESGTVKIDLNGVSSGVYVVKVSTKDDQFIQKILIE